MTHKSSISTFPKRGELYYIKESILQTPIGQEMWPNRVGLIVSSNTLNKTAGFVQIVYLSTSENKLQHLTPTHIPVTSDGKPAVVICEQLYSVDNSRLHHKVGTIPLDQMPEIEEGILLSLNINTGKNPQGLFHKWERYINTYPSLKEDIQTTDIPSEEELHICQKLIAERNAYQKLIEALEDKLKLINQMTTPPLN